MYLLHSMIGRPMVVVCASVVCSSVEAQPCEPEWAAGLFSIPSLAGPIHAMTVFDDGSGPTLFIAYQTGQHLIRWTGSTWELMPNMVEPVRALRVFDDGDGQALYAGGEFTEIQGDIELNHVGRWDGETWSPVGQGLNDDVLALVVFDDGDGEALYAGGDFFEARLEGIHFVSRWDGNSWTPLNTGLKGVFNDLNGAAYAFAVYNDGSGEALYVAGEFTLASGVTVNRIAKWDGMEWTALGEGMDAPIFTLTVFNDGSGDALYAGGVFTSAGETPALHTAKWDGLQWHDLQGGTDGIVHALQVHPDDSGPKLWVGGEFQTVGETDASFIAKWDGSTWSPAGSGVADGSGSPDGVFAFGVLEETLYLGGDFAMTTLGASPSTDIARWNGTDWELLGHGVSNGIEASLASDFDPVAGPSLYVAGEFNIAGGIIAPRIARWDGMRWWPLGEGLSGQARALAIYDDGSGPALYVAGQINSDKVNNNIGKWDGQQWHSLGGGIVQANIGALAVYDGGDGAELYVGGAFQDINVPDSWLVKWNGSQWSAVGGGVDGPVTAMIVHDDGSGPALFVGGNFDTAGGQTANSIAKWDGVSWSVLGAGLGGVAGPFLGSMAVFDDGNGPALFVGGHFTTAGEDTANRIARWDGVSWSALGEGADGYVGALLTFDDGDGDALYVGGEFESAGGMSAEHIARWDGSAWSILSTGIDSAVRDLAVFDDGSGSAIHAVGSFHYAGGVSSQNIAKWLHCSPTQPCDLDGDGVVGVKDLLILLGTWGPCPPKGDCPADFDGSGDVGVKDLLILLGNWGPCP